MTIQPNRELSFVAEMFMEQTTPYNWQNSKIGTPAIERHTDWLDMSLNALSEEGQEWEFYYH
jgi:hypothetical protein